MMLSSWLGIKPKEEEKKEESPPPPPISSSNDTKSVKQVKWQGIVNSAGNKYKPNATYSSYVKVMKYNKKDDCIDCECGAKLWTATRCKPSDLGNHLVTVGHTNWCDEKRKKRLNKLQDIKDNVLYYPFLIATFAAVYFIIRYRLPLHLIGPFNALFVFLGIQCSGVSYLWAVNDIVESFYRIRYDEIKYLIQHSNWYGISLDESVSKVGDRYNHKNKTDHIKLKVIPNGKAETIFKAARDFLHKNLELEHDNLVSATGDNCKTNMGKKKGVFARLSEIYLALIIIGCFAHKLALAISAALLLLNWFIAIERILKRLVKWARAGTNRCRALAVAATEAEEDAKKIGIIHKIRWLARENVSKAIYSSKYSILTVLKEEYEQDLVDAIWLYPRLCSVYFWLLFTLFIDILCCIGILQRYFQGDWVYIGKSRKRLNVNKIATPRTRASFQQINPTYDQALQKNQTYLKLTKHALKVLNKFNKHGYEDINSLLHTIKHDIENMINAQQDIQRTTELLSLILKHKPNNINMRNNSNAQPLWNAINECKQHINNTILAIIDIQYNYFQYLTRMMDGNTTDTTNECYVSCSVTYKCNKMSKRSQKQTLLILNNILQTFVDSATFIGAMNDVYRYYKQCHKHKQYISNIEICIEEELSGIHHLKLEQIKIEQRIHYLMSTNADYPSSADVQIEIENLVKTISILDQEKQKAKESVTKMRMDIVEQKSYDDRKVNKSIRSVNKIINKTGVRQENIAQFLFNVKKLIPAMIRIQGSIDKLHFQIKTTQALINRNLLIQNVYQYSIKQFLIDIDEYKFDMEPSLKSLCLNGYINMHHIQLNSSNEFHANIRPLLINASSSMILTFKRLCFDKRWKSIKTLLNTVTLRKRKKFNFVFGEFKFVSGSYN